MKRLLIAGGSHSDIPMIQAARARGYYIISSGNNPNDFGHRHADETHLADYSQPKDILKLARKLKIDALCPSSNDFSMISCAFAAEQLNLPGFDSYSTTLLLHHKDQFRAFAAKQNLPCPQAHAFQSLEEALNFTPLLPAIIKPIDLTGGKGIHRVDTLPEYHQAVHAAFAYSKAKRIVVEDFFPGQLHSYSTFICGQKVVFEYFDTEYCHFNPYLVSTSIAPADLPLNCKMELREQIEHTARILNLHNGILHTQFLFNGKELQIIEMTRRSPGDFYALPVQRATGINYADEIIKPFLDIKPANNQKHQPRGYVSRHCMIGNKSGKITDITISEQISKYIYDIFWLKKRGDSISKPGIDKAGILFLEYPSAQVMYKINSLISDLVQVHVIEE